jgi:hypothetical protein
MLPELALTRSQPDAIVARASLRKLAYGGFDMRLRNTALAFLIATEAEPGLPLRQLAGELIDQLPLGEAENTSRYLSLFTRAG